MTSALADDHRNAIDASATAMGEVASQQMQQYELEWVAWVERMEEWPMRTEEEVLALQTNC